MQVLQPAVAQLLQYQSLVFIAASQASLFPAWQRSRMDQQALREFVLEYASELKDLTFNSKTLINTLTMLAGDNLDAASSVAAAIDQHILTVSSISCFYEFTRSVTSFNASIALKRWRLPMSSSLTWHAVCPCPQAVCPVPDGQHSEEYWLALHHTLCRKHSRGKPYYHLCVLCDCHWEFCRKPQKAKKQTHATS